MTAAKRPTTITVRTLGASIVGTLLAASLALTCMLDASGCTRWPHGGTQTTAAAPPRTRPVLGIGACTDDAPSPRDEVIAVPHGNPAEAAQCEAPAAMDWQVASGGTDAPAVLADL